MYRAQNKPLPVPHAAEWMMIPEHSVEQVLETGALESLYPKTFSKPPAAWTASAASTTNDTPERARAR
jgi:hypothetical protein